ncbi:MAG: ABC transporter substrate-binding protein [Alphaproteobacteria bacterium]|nr:ABC transporter substrate-binding protein [Alphaproteobacteria bacterium]
MEIRRGNLLLIGTGIALAALSPTVSLADPLPAATPLLRPAPSQQVDANAFIQNLGNQAIGTITDRSLSETQRTSRYYEILRNAFDMKTIGRFVIGRAWNTAQPAQQAEFMKLFEDLVVRIYGDRLKLYNGQSFRVKGARPESEKDVIVSSEVVPSGGGQPTSVDWRVRNEGDRLAIIDVVINGVSQSVTQRQEYAAIIQRDGGRLDMLLDYMRERAHGG